MEKIKINIVLGYVIQENRENILTTYRSLVVPTKHDSLYFNNISYGINKVVHSVSNIGQMEVYVFVWEDHQRTFLDNKHENSYFYLYEYENEKIVVKTFTIVTEPQFSGKVISITEGASGLFKLNFGDVSNTWNRDNFKLMSKDMVENEQYYIMKDELNGKRLPLIIKTKGLIETETFEGEVMSISNRISKEFIADVGDIMDEWVTSEFRLMTEEEKKKYNFLGND